jgi:DNA primase catalytic core
VYITNVDELVVELRSRLPVYLEKMIGPEAANLKGKFPCFAHEDGNPSMSYNPKNGFTTVRCWSGCGNFDIFRAAAELEELPMSGPEFITETLPTLAAKLNVEVQIGAISPEDKERAKLYKLANDIANIIETTTEADEYIKERGWANTKLTIGTVDTGALIATLREMGWSQQDLTSSLMIRTATSEFMGSHMVTFVIKDHRGRPIGFVSRNTGKNGPKYINSHETSIYEKRRTLLGLDVALKDGHAKRDGLYIVEGPGDLAALHRVGIYNAAAVCGTAFTGEHLALLKMVGVKHAFFCLDWDEAGESATERILVNEIKFAPGVSCSVIKAPENGAKDPGEFLKDLTDGTAFQALQKVAAFEWTLGRVSDKATPDEVCTNMVPLIAAETTAIRRELLTKQLSEFSGISYQSITQDVSAIRDGKERERLTRLEGAAQKYLREVTADPSNMQSYLSQHEADLEEINKEYEKTATGIAYQVSRLDALEESKASVTSDRNMAEFQFGYFRAFGAAISGGMSNTDGNLVYFGGRANASKTAVTTSLGLDVAMTDEHAIVVIHSTDDSYSQITPRLVTTVARMQQQPGEHTLTIGESANPYRNIHDESGWDVYLRAVSTLRHLLATERLVLMDSEDGNNLSTLERQVKYLRSKYPDKKILLILDNTYNLNDHPTFDQTNRMRMIATAQKDITAKYHCAMFATVEYRKNMPLDTSKMKLPVDDDVADARAMMYRPNIIIHVYNDLNDRKDDAAIFWIDRELKLRRPRLMLIFSKNKITSFKSPDQKIMMDLDPVSVTLRETNIDDARSQAEQFQDAMDNGEVEVHNDHVYYVEAD